MLEGIIPRLIPTDTFPSRTGLFFIENAQN